MERGQIDIIAALRRIDTEDTKRVHRNELSRLLYEVGYYEEGHRLEQFLNAMEICNTPMIDVNYFLSYMPIISPHVLSAVKHIKARILDYLNSIYEPASTFFGKYD